MKLTSYNLALFGLHGTPKSTFGGVGYLTNFHMLQKSYMKEHEALNRLHFINYLTFKSQ